MPTIQFQLNGTAAAVDTDPDQTLLDVLRGRLGVTSPHFGCGAGECGACHVMVDDRAMASCDMPMWSVADKDVVTVEGLGTVDATASAATCLYRRTGDAMRLLRLGNPDQRGGAAEAQSVADGGRGENRA